MPAQKDWVRGALGVGATVSGALSAPVKRPGVRPDQGLLWEVINQSSNGAGFHATSKGNHFSTDKCPGILVQKFPQIDRLDR